MDTFASIAISITKYIYMDTFVSIAISITIYIYIHNWKIMYELCGSKFEDNIYCENEEIKLKRIKNINLKKT